jgi:hypothetical protein
MTTTTSTDTTRTDANWAVEYDVDPIRIRDPVAEVLGVLDAGQPFEIEYADLVQVAGHSCPTAAGAYRLAQVGLDALYPDELPVRGDIEVLVPGPREDSTYGLLARLLSTVTGAAQADGFPGLGDGIGDRRNRLHYDAFEAPGPAPTVRFRRRDTGETVAVTYRLSDVPGEDPALEHLGAVIDGTATDGERAAFETAWHDRVRTVLREDSLFAVRTVEDE